MSARRFDSSSIPETRLCSSKICATSLPLAVIVVSCERLVFLERARLAAVGELGAKAVHRRERLADAGAPFDARLGAEAMRPFAVQARQRRAGSRGRLGGVVGRRDGADGLRQRAVAARVEAVREQDRRQRHRIGAALGPPLDSRRRVDAAAADAQAPVVDLLERDRAVVEAAVDRRRRAAVVAVDVERAQRIVDDEVARA